MHHICAAGYIMKWIVQADKQYHINPDCLLLIIAIVWLVNSLNSRHKDNLAGRDLMDAKIYPSA